MNEEESYYCEKCHGCGYIGCDGIESFLKNHVAGNTDCKHEEQFIDEIIEHIDEDNPYYWPSIAEVDDELSKIVDAAYAAGRERRDFDVHDEKKDAFVRLVTGQNLKEGVEPDVGRYFYSRGPNTLSNLYNRLYTPLHKRGDRIPQME